VVLTPGAEKSATGVSLTALTESVHSDAAIPTGRKCLLLMYPEKLVYSNATEDNADIPLDIIYVAVQIPPNHLYDISAKWNFNLTKIAETY
jgi:hypothetical protein